jgi:sugar/nucleoside kinase (ribokinase family)
LTAHFLTADSGGSYAVTSKSLMLLLFGEINLDIILHGLHAFPEPGREVLVDDSAMTLGSSCAITAAGLTKLGNSVAYLGKTGADHAGRLCVERMQQFGIDVSRVKLDPLLKTGITVSLAFRQDRSLISHLGATTVLTAADIPDNVLGSFRHVHSSSYFLQTGLLPGFGDVFSRAKQQGLTTSLDPACDPAGEWKSGLDEVLRHVDVFLPNEVELAGITGEKDPVLALRRLENGVTLTVAKLGPRGAMVLHEGKPLQVSAPAIDPLDLTGAGDCFNAGFLHAWLRGSSLSDALQLGVSCGSFSTQALGGTGAQPTEEQAETYLNSLAERNV